MSVLSNNTLAGSSGQGGSGYEIERSLRFSSGDSAFLNRTPSSASNRKTFTWSGWLKLSQGASAMYFFGTSTSFIIYVTADNKLRAYNYTSGFTYDLMLEPTRVFRDQSAWFHLVVSIDTTQATASDRAKMYVNGTLETSFTTATYPSQNFDCAVNTTVQHAVGNFGTNTSYYFDGYLADIHFIDGQALAASDFGEYDTNNVWQPKKYAGTYGTNGFKLDFSDTSSNAALGTDSSTNSNTWTVNNLSATNLGATTNSGVSATYTHLVSDVMATVTGTYDFSHAFDGNASTIGYMGQVIFYNEGSYSKPTVANSSGGVEVRAAGNGITATINGGSQVSCTNGAFTKISGTFDGTLNSINVYNNTNGVSYFYAVKINGVEIAVRKKGDASDIDVLRDSPVNGDSADDTGAGGEITGNYATLNPLSLGSQVTIANGNLDVTATSTGNGREHYSTFGMSSGKWYAEFTKAGASAAMVGIADAITSGSTYLGGSSNGWGYYSNGTTYHSNTNASYGASYATGDTIGVAFDADIGTLTFYKNGASQGAAFTGLTNGPYFHAGGENGMTGSWNFGQRAFKHPVSGYKCLNTANLPDPTIADGSTAFDTKLWTGNGGTQAITGYNFSPDFAWIKQRSGTDFHSLFDVVRGGTKVVFSNTNIVEETKTDAITAFNSDGFSLAGWPAVNKNTDTFVGWAWDGGSSNTTIAAGGLNSSVYNQSQTWSNFLYTADGPADAATVTTKNFSSSYPATLPFNGNGNGSHETYANANLKTIVLRPNTALTGVTKLEIYTNGAYASNVGYNSATSVITGNTTVGWQTLYEGTAITVNYVWSYRNNGTGSFTGVKVNGRMFVDSGVTPPTSVPLIASTVRANPSAGFSIVKYTGNNTASQTVAHGLNSEPALMFVKSTDFATNWCVYHKELAANGFLRLDDTNAVATDVQRFTSTPSTSVFTVGTDAEVNYNNKNYIAYCFAPVEQYSSFGSFLGNGVADGSFVYTGFAPAFVLIKNTSASGTFWTIFDDKRGSGELYPNETNAESYYPGNTTVPRVLLTSNGFKMTATQNTFNGSGNVMIYAAFASHPFKNSRAH